MQGFVNEMEAAMLQVAQATVHQLRGHTAGPRSEIPLIAQGNPEAAQAGIQGHSRPGDAAAQDEQIEGPLRQGVHAAFHGVIISERG